MLCQIVSSHHGFAELALFLHLLLLLVHPFDMPCKILSCERLFTDATRDLAIIVKILVSIFAVLLMTLDTSSGTVGILRTSGLEDFNPCTMRGWVASHIVVAIAYRDRQSLARRIFCFIIGRNLAHCDNHQIQNCI